MPDDFADIRSYARWVADNPGGTLWLGHSTMLDAAGMASYLSGGGIRIPYGFGVALTPLVHPLHAATIARSVSKMSANNTYYGLGISSQDFAEAVTGNRLERPASHVAEYLQVMRAALGGEPFVHDGDMFRVTGTIHEMAGPTVEIGAGVLRPAMARRVSRSADFAITWLTPPEYIVQTLLPSLRVSEGPFHPRVVASVQFLLSHTGIDPVRAMLETNSSHIRAAHYREMLKQAGVVVDSHDEDSKVAKRAIAAGSFMYGSAEEIALRLREMSASGVDEVVLNPAASYFHRGARSALDDVTRVADALRTEGTAEGLGDS